MLSLGFVLESLKGNIIRLQLKHTELSAVSIAFAQGDGAYASNVLLLCEGPLLPALLQKGQVEKGATILVAGNPAELALPNAKMLNIIVTNLSTLQLYHLFATVIAQNQYWKETFLETMLTHADLESILSYASSFSGSAVFLFSQDSRLISSSVPPTLEDTCLEEIMRQGALPGGAPAGWLPRPYYGLEEIPGFTRFYSVQSGCYYYLCQLSGSFEAFSALLIAGGTDPLEYDIQSLASLIVRSVKKTLRSNQAEQNHTSGDLYMLLRNIMEGSVSLQEVRRQLRFAPHPVKNFCAIGVVEFERRFTAVPYGHIMRQLEEVFPQCNMLVYENAVIILISFEERSMRIQFDGAKLHALLEQHGAYIGISNATRNRAMLRTLCIMAKDTVKLARVLRSDLKDRIFLHENYSMYNIIHLCASRFQEIHGHDDLIYLIHPSIVEIARYDQKHNNNLLEVLYQYLLNNRNLTQTAKALYLHRNTVIKKVGKLTKIIGADLDNGELQSRIMFSCQFVRYVTLYLERNVKLN